MKLFKGKSIRSNERDHFMIIFVRYILGSIFVLSGLNAFIPEFTTTFAPDSIIALMKSDYSYFYFSLKLLEIMAGSFVLFNFFVPTALIILIPIIFNIIIYSAFYNTGNLPMALFLSTLTITLMVYYRRFYTLFLKPQFYSDSLREGTAKFLVLEEVEEKLPEEKANVEKLIQKLTKA